jgi:hypothetical protein
MSDSWTRANPSMADPSKPTPSRKACGNSAAGNASDLSMPRTSTNQRRMK